MLCWLFNISYYERQARYSKSNLRFKSTNRVKSSVMLVAILYISFACACGKGISEQKISVCVQEREREERVRVRRMDGEREKEKTIAVGN